MESSGGDKPTTTDGTESVLDKDHSERSITSAGITLIRQPRGVSRISALRVGVESAHQLMVGSIKPSKLDFWCWTNL